MSMLSSNSEGDGGFSESESQSSSTEDIPPTTCWRRSTICCVAVLGALAIFVVVVFIVQEVSTKGSSLSSEAQSYPPLRSFNWCGTHKVVALTYDSTPVPEQMAVLLTTLKRLNVQASFYLAPERQAGVEPTPAQCHLVEEILRDGHDVHSRSYDGSDFKLTSKSNDEIEANLGRWLDWARGCAGQYADSKLAAGQVQFRPPYASLDVDMAGNITQLGYAIATWNVDSNDWRGGNAETVVQAVLDGASTLPEGASLMILFEERAASKESGIRALEQVVGTFRAKGYRFVTTSECYAMCEDDVCALRGVWPGVYDDVEVHSF